MNTTETAIGWRMLSRWNVGDRYHPDRSELPDDGDWCGAITWRNTKIKAYARPSDVLFGSIGNTLCHVEVSGDRREMRILSRVDARHLLRRFAADQAMGVAHLWDMPDIVRQYLEVLAESDRHFSRKALQCILRETDNAWDIERQIIYHAAASAFAATSQRMSCDEAMSAAIKAKGAMARHLRVDPIFAMDMEPFLADFNQRVYSAFSISSKLGDTQ